MQAVFDYIESRPNPQQREIFLALHEMFMAYPGVSARIRFKIPFYYRKTWVCYLNPLKNDGVECCFVRGNELSNEQGLLHFGNRTQVGGISIFHVREIPMEALTEVFQEAVALDEAMRYASKRKK